MRQMIVIALICACGPTVQSGGITVYADQWAATTRELAYHANADMGACGSRTFTLLERYKSAPVRVAVDGCGLSGVYERRKRGKVTYKNGASWVLATKPPASPPLVGPAF
jgi:hypothetical protein